MKKLFIAIAFLIAGLTAAPQVAHAQFAEIAGTPRYTVPNYGDYLGTWQVYGGLGYIIQVFKKQPSDGKWYGVVIANAYSSALDVQAAINGAGGMSGFLHGEYAIINARLAATYPPTGGVTPTGDPTLDAIDNAVAQGLHGAQVNGSPAFVGS